MQLLSASPKFRQHREASSPSYWMPSAKELTWPILGWEGWASSPRVWAGCRLQRDFRRELQRRDTQKRKDFVAVGVIIPLLHTEDIWIQHPLAQKIAFSSLVCAPVFHSQCQKAKSHSHLAHIRVNRYLDDTLTLVLPQEIKVWIWNRMHIHVSAFPCTRMNNSYFIYIFHLSTFFSNKIRSWSQ